MATSRYHLRDALRIPGLISLARAPLAIAFPWAASKPRFAIGLLVLAAGTDVMDGWCARRFHQETATGAVLDGLMDKAFVLSVVVTMLEARMLTPLDVLLLATRDLGELPLVVRTVLRRRISTAAPQSNGAGKVATVLQFATFAAVLDGTSHKESWVLATSVCGVLAAAAYWVRESSAPPDESKKVARSIAARGKFEARHRSLNR